MSKQKFKELLIGTNNKGKLKEIRSLLPNYIKIYSTSNFKLKSPAENGKTFEENSLIKSKHFSKKTGLICLADDSGLEIDHLDKRLVFILHDGEENLGILIKLLKKFLESLIKKIRTGKIKKLKQDLFVLYQFIF